MILLSEFTLDVTVVDSVGAVVGALAGVAVELGGGFDQATPYASQELIQSTVNHLLK